VDKIYNAAKQVITGDISDETKLIAKRKQVVDALKDAYNVSEAEVLKAIGKQALQHITADDLVVLIGIGTAIKDGDTTVEEAFRGGKKKEEPLPTVEELQKLLDVKMEFLTKKEIDDV